MSNKREWFKAEIEGLIISYQSKPELWDVMGKNYKNRVKKQAAWKEMADKFNTTVEEIQRKIHNLRNQFNSEFKKQKKTKPGQSTDEQQLSKWPYYNLLLFLQGGKQTKGNLWEDTALEETRNENNTASDNQGPSFDQSDEGNHLDFTPISLKNIDLLHSMKKRKIEVCKDDLLMEKAIKTLNQEEDQYDIFGKYVASEMRNLSSEYLRKKMKRLFQQVILQINEEDELQSSPGYSTPNSVASVRENFASSSNSEQYGNIQSSPTYIKVETSLDL